MTALQGFKRQPGETVPEWREGHLAPNRTHKREQAKNERVSPSGARETNHKGKHNEQNRQRGIPQKKSRSTRRQPSVPLGMRQARNRSRPPHRVRHKRRRLTARTILQTMQRTTRSQLHQRQTNPTSTRQSRTPRTQPNEQTKTTRQHNFFERGKNHAPVPFFLLI